MSPGHFRVFFWHLLSDLSVNDGFDPITSDVKGRLNTDTSPQNF